jgi:hypothetical protein
MLEVESKQLLVRRRPVDLAVGPAMKPSSDTPIE